MANLKELFELLDEYQNLGWSIQAQLKDVAVKLESVKEQNPEGISIAKSFIESLAHYFKNTKTPYDLSDDLLCLADHIQKGLGKG